MLHNSCFVMLRRSLSVLSITNMMNWKIKQPTLITELLETVCTHTHTQNTNNKYFYPKYTILSTNYTQTMIVNIFKRWYNKSQKQFLFIYNTLTIKISLLLYHLYQLLLTLSIQIIKLLFKKNTLYYINNLFSSHSWYKT